MESIATLLSCFVVWQQNLMERARTGLEKKSMEKDRTDWVTVDRVRTDGMGQDGIERLGMELSRTETRKRS